MSHTDDSLREIFLEVSASQVGDSMGRLNIMDSKLAPIGSFDRLVGRAYTVQTAGGDNKMIHDAIHEISPGEVLVVDGQAAIHRALIGELIAERYQRAGCAGFVVDGAVRDAEEISDLNFPVYARAVTPGGPYRNGPGHLQRAVSVGGVVVKPGDWIVGDRDGIAVVPYEEASEIAKRAKSKLEHELQQQRDIRAGVVT